MKGQRTAVLSYVCCLTRKRLMSTSESNRPPSLPEAPGDTPAAAPRRVVVRRISSESPLATRPEPNSGAGCLRLFIGALLTVLVVVVLGALLTVGGLSAAVNGLLGAFGSVPVAPPPQAAVVSTQTIVTSIQSMGQLVSISTQLAKADINVTIVQGVLGSGSFTASHVAQGAVEAGIDLTQLTGADVRYDAITDTYTVTLPPAQLTSCRVDYIRQYASTVQLLPVDRDEARLLANYIALTEFRDDAVEGGILDRAEQQAGLVFSNIVTALTNSNAAVIFADSASAALPASCNPDIPGAWNYDPATQTWTQPE